MYKTRFGARPEPYPSIVIERLPFAEVDRHLRAAVKRVIGFQDAASASAEPAGGPTPDGSHISPVR